MRRFKIKLILNTTCRHTHFLPIIQLNHYNTNYNKLTNENKNGHE